jgi:hypothetical protein
MTIKKKEDGNTNALSHGFYATETVLPWESAEEFSQLCSELNDEWQPVGRTERETVAALARLYWIKNRLQRTWNLAFRGDPFVREIEHKNLKSWPEIDDYVKSVGDTSFDAKKEAVALRSRMDENLAELSEEIRKANESSRSADLEVLTKTRQEIASCSSMLNKFFVLGAQSADERQKKHSFDGAYLPDHLEKVIKLESLIDGRLDKTMARLVSIQEYKRIQHAASHAAAKKQPPALCFKESGLSTDLR